MRNKLSRLSRYQTEHVLLDAALYNQVKLKLIRSNSPYRFKVPGMKNIDMVLDENYWVCLDTIVSDNPIFTWIDFQIKQRDSLHMPINCKIYYYNARAESLIKPVTEAIWDELKSK